MRDSLNYYTYFEHAKSTKLAADECLKVFLEIIHSPPFQENVLKGLGLHRSTLMLYALTVELLLKSVALYFEKARIESGHIKTFHEFLKILKDIPGNSNGHNFIPIIVKYGLSFSIEELDFIKSLQDFTIWAGRFPFPLNEDQIKAKENLFGPSGPSLSFETKNKIESILNRIEYLIFEG